ncbi:MAG TPA: hypothetical protein VN902_14255 [Candidatus Acidoferrales bacterium]|jgi:hypothetical protein|nr:hypothetical protein [Candidatus Acidoferrales bacterium]
MRESRTIVESQRLSREFVLFVALAGERNKLADSAKDVLTDASRAMRILLRDELSDFGNILCFASVELKALG